MEVGATGGRPRVFLHVGAPKTGTTYLQNVLWHNSDALAADGLLVPGTGARRPWHLHSHHEAALRLRRLDFAEGLPQRRTTWQSLADEAHGWPGDVLVSSELLAWTGPPEIEQAVTPWPGHEVHLVLTMRDLLRQVPAAWQEEVKNRRTLSYEEFLAEAVASDAMHGGPGGVWGGQDPRQVLGRWAADVPAERVHVVTVPPPGAGPHVLWERYCQVLGLDPAAYDTDVAGRNPGLGLAEAELLRRVSLALPDSFGWESYNRLLKHGLAESEAFAGEVREKVPVPDEVRAALAERTAGMIEYVVAAGFEVVGDLGDLAVSSEPAGLDAAAARPTPEAVADAGVRAVADLLLRLERLPDREPPLAALRQRSPAAHRRAARARLRRAARAAVPASLRARLRRG